MTRYLATKLVFIYNIFANTQSAKVHTIYSIVRMLTYVDTPGKVREGERFLAKFLY